jgi:hypothetical protein
MSGTCHWRVVAPVQSTLLYSDAEYKAADGTVDGGTDGGIGGGSGGAGGLGGAGGGASEHVRR